MKILAVDTTGQYGSLALAENGTVIAEAELFSTDGYAHVVFAKIQKLLFDNFWQLSDIKCFASASGPGSFTGVRVGLTVVKGLAEASSASVSAVSNLRALASFGTGNRRAVLIDARRDEVYAAVYDDALLPLIPETVTRISKWLNALTGDDYEFIASSGSGLLDHLNETRFAQMPRTVAPESLAGAVAQCAWTDAQVGALLSPVEADANYVRRSDAESFWKDRA
jgi:tRNA threonylcarbamoyladenosine biosynthesis protein TsaB